MSFKLYEESLESGEPINLYRFIYGVRPQDVLCYTDSEREIEYAGDVYKPVPIKRSDITSSSFTDKTAMTVNMPLDEELPELFRIYPPSHPVRGVVFEGHEDDAGQDYKLVWMGTVLSCARADDAVLTCEPATISLNRVGLRRNWQYMCSHVLYGPRCRANKAAATVPGVVFSVQGRIITLATTLVNTAQFAGGIIEWEGEGGRYEIRTVLQAVVVGGRTVLTLSGIAPSLGLGGSLTVSKGCKHDRQDCLNVHNNINNFGGQPFIPLKNPLGLSTPFV